MTDQDRAREPLRPGELPPDEDFGPMMWRTLIRLTPLLVGTPLLTSLSAAWPWKLALALLTGVLLGRLWARRV